MLSDGDTTAELQMHEGMVCHHYINSHEYVAYYNGNVSLTKQTECLSPGLISGK